MRRLSTILGICLAALVIGPDFARAEGVPPDEGCAQPAVRQSSVPGEGLDTRHEFPCGCLPLPKPRPLPEYGGCFLKRRSITGDWGGTRTNLARRGFTAELWTTHVTQGLLADGAPGPLAEGESDWATLVRSTLVLHFNTERAGLWRGGSILFRGNARTGDALLTRAGGLSVANTVAVVPLPDPDIEILAVGALIYKQWITGRFGVHLGLLDTLDRDMNAFAWGDGGEQFLNLALTINQMYNFVMRPTPLGVKFVYLPTGDPKDIAAQLTIASGNDLATFSEDPEGIFAHGEVGYGYTLNKRPGRHKLGATFGWNPSYRDLDRQFSHLPPGTLDPRKSNTWSVDYNWWQYVDTYAGRKHKGWGLFFRFGLSDGNPNPYHVSLSGGIGGDAKWRPQDGFGVGCYWTKVSDAAVTRPLDDEYGLEAFYRVGITPWLHVTLDVQAIHPAVDLSGDKLLFALRTRWKF